MSTKSIARMIAKGQDIPHNDSFENIGTSTEKISRKGPIETPLGPFNFSVTSKDTALVGFDSLLIDGVSYRGCGYLSMCVADKVIWYFVMAHMARENGGVFEIVTDSCRKKASEAIKLAWSSFIELYPEIISNSIVNRITAEISVRERNIVELMKRIKDEEESIEMLKKKLSELNK